MVLPRNEEGGRKSFYDGDKEEKNAMVALRGMRARPKRRSARADKVLLAFPLFYMVVFILKRSISVAHAWRLEKREEMGPCSMRTRCSRLGSRENWNEGSFGI